LTDISGTTGWELALVTTPSNHMSQAPDRKMVCVTTSLLSIIIHIGSHTSVTNEFNLKVVFMAVEKFSFHIIKLNQVTVNDLVLF
jgi:hypothetical protein